MKTLLENLLKGTPKTEPEKVIMDALDKSVFIKIDNVSKYLFQDVDQEYWDIRTDFPNIAPPFEFFFMEFKLPEFYRSNGKVSKNPSGGILIGALFISHKLNDSKGWVYNIIAFSTKRGQDNPIFFPGTAMVLMVDINGKQKDMVGGQPYGIVYSEKEYSRDEISETIDTFYRGAVDSCLLAISFMHCKNISLVDNEPKKNDAGRNRYGPKIAFKTLLINPMKKVLETEGDIHHNGLKKALHICRGHFKTYEDGKGLFGRYPGTYWWSDQVRGKIENGIVEKDYSVGVNK